METRMFSPIGLLVLVVALVGLKTNPVNKVDSTKLTQKNEDLQSCNFFALIRPPP